MLPIDGRAKQIIRVIIIGVGIAAKIPGSLLAT
jgi:hypothetical protein